MIKSALNDLKNEIKEMSEDEKETEQPKKIVNLVKTILEFNNQNQERKRVENTNTRSNDW